jgi:hypothetical protein
MRMNKKCLLILGVIVMVLMVGRLLQVRTNDVKPNEIIVDRDGIEMEEVESETVVELKEDIFVDELREEELEETKALAGLFVTAYHRRTPTYHYLEQIEEFVSEGYYRTLSENEERQTFDREYQVIKEIEIVETADKKTSNYITWCVMVYGEYKDLSETITKENSTDIYIVTLEKREGVWQVVRSWINPRN